MFFLAVAPARLAYLTVSVSSPVEFLRLALGLLSAAGTGADGFSAPALFGALIGSGSEGAVAAGYGFGAALVIIAGAFALRFGVDAERKPLEEVARPLNAR